MLLPRWWYRQVESVICLWSHRHGEAEWVCSQICWSFSLFALISESQCHLLGRKDNMLMELRESDEKWARILALSLQRCCKWQVEWAWSSVIIPSAHHEPPVLGFSLVPDNLDQTDVYGNLLSVCYSILSFLMKSILYWLKNQTLSPSPALTSEDRVKGSIKLQWIRKNPEVASPSSHHQMGLSVTQHSHPFLSNPDISIQHFLPISVPGWLLLAWVGY